MSGFTQLPNWLIEAMPQMPASTFQIAIVIARQTVGYSDGNGGRKEWDRISLTKFEKATGLSRQGVLNAIDAGLGKWFGRRETGQWFEYKLVNLVDQLGEPEHETSQLSVPVVVNLVDQLGDEPVNSVDQSDPKLVNSVDTQKKERKERTKKKKRKDSTSPATPEPRTLTPQQEFFAAVCEAIGWDYKTLTKEASGRVAQTIGVLKNADYTVADVRRFMLEVWFQDFRWTEKTQRPTLNVLRNEIGKIRAGVPVDMPVNGSGPSRQGPNADVIDRAFARLDERGIGP